MKTLMHTCCAPCSVSCIRQLRSEGIEPVSYWFNPNIHPYQAVSYTHLDVYKRQP